MLGTLDLFAASNYSLHFGGRKLRPHLISIRLEQPAIYIPGIHTICSAWAVLLCDACGNPRHPLNSLPYPTTHRAQTCVDVAQYTADGRPELVSAASKAGKSHALLPGGPRACNAPLLLLLLVRLALIRRAAPPGAQVSQHHGGGWGELFTSNPLQNRSL